MDLWPLLKKQVIVQSVELIKPDIYVTFAPDGSLNWLTPQLQNTAPKDETQDGADFGQSVSLEKVTITQGVLTFLPQGAEEPLVIQNVNLEVAADTLKGPFKLKGGLLAFGQEINLDVTTGRLTDDAASLPVNIAVTAMKGQAALNYAGVVGLGAPFEIQGETALILADANSLAMPATATGAKLPVTVKGLLTFAAERVQMKNMTLDVASQPLTGSFFYDMGVKKAEVALRSGDMFNLDNILSRLPAASQKTQDSGAFIPDTVSLPADFEAALTAELPGLVYRGELYKSVNLSAEKIGPKISFKGDLGEIPGGGALNSSGKLEFMDVSSSKNGGVTYSEPVLSVRGQAETKNLPFILQTFGLEQAPLSGMWSKGSVDMNAEIKPSLVTLKSANLKLDDMTVSMTGAYSQTTSAGPSTLTAALNIDKLNYDTLQAALKPSAPAPAAANAAPQGAVIPVIALPFDLDLDVNVGNLRAMSHNIQGARARAVLSGDTLSKGQVTVENLAGAQGSMNVSIKSLKQLSGIEAAITANTSDMGAFAQAMKIELPELPKAGRSAQVQASLSGDVQKAEVKANIKVLEAQILAQGAATSLLQNMAFNDVTLQIKHPNLSQLLESLNPEAQRMKALSKPLDAYAKVQREGNLYKIGDLKADIAGIAMEGALDVNTAQTVPAVNGTLRFGDVVLSDNTGNAQTERVRSSSGGAGRNQGDVRWSREALDWGWMQSVNMNLQVSANSFRQDHIFLTTPQAAISLQDGNLMVKDMNAGLYGGTLTVNGNVKADKNPRLPVQIAGQGQLRDVDLAQLSALLKNTGYITARGKAGFDIDLKTSGVSQAALIYDLNGKGALSGEDIVLEGFDLAKFASALSVNTKPGDTLSGIWGSASRSGSTAFDVMDGEYTIKEGVINIVKLDMDGPAAHMATTGQINLPLWSLKTQHEVTLKQQPEGETIPPFSFKFEGPLDDPAQTFGQGPLQDYLTQKINRKLEKVLTDKLGDKLNTPLGGVIGGVLGLPSAPANDNTPAPATTGEQAPAPETVAPTEPQQAQPEPETAPAAPPTPDEALRGLLQGILQ